MVWYTTPYHTLACHHFVFSFFHLCILTRASRMDVRWRLWWLVPVPYTPCWVLVDSCLRFESRENVERNFARICQNSARRYNTTRPLIFSLPSLCRGLPVEQYYFAAKYGIIQRDTAATPSSIPQLLPNYHYRNVHCPRLEHNNERVPSQSIDDDDGRNACLFVVMRFFVIVLVRRDCSSSSRFVFNQWGTISNMASQNGRTTGTCGCVYHWQWRRRHAHAVDGWLWFTGLAKTRLGVVWE